MSNKVKDFLSGLLFVIILTVAMGGCIYYCTSDKVWYAGEHTINCDGSDDCGCYEKLLKAGKGE